MKFQSYLDYFKEIIYNIQPPPPYDDALYIDYTKLNWSRVNRWLKSGQIIKEMSDAIKSINKKQTWIIITEPWCGDAAHIVPFIEIIAKTNPLITTDYELRDTAPFRIDQYLTNGSKSIPILIIRDEHGKDLFKWGPRPTEAQIAFKKLADEGADFETTKLALQHWYNQDKGQSMQKELVDLFGKL